MDESFDIVVYHSLGMTHDPVVIDGDAELAAFVEDNNLMGDGSVSDPYVLATWLINAGGSRHCISISNTTYHFIISNCVFHNATDASLSTIRDESNPVITEAGNYFNNTIYGPGWEASPHELVEAPFSGIRIFDSSNITVQDCTFEGCYVSIEVIDSCDIIVERADIALYPAVGSIGVSVTNCDRVSIYDNILIGLDLEDAEAFQEALNIYYVQELVDQYDLVGWYGIRIVDSLDISLDGNEFTNFHPYHASYTNREWIGGNDHFRDYVWITGYSGSNDAWAIYINRSESISLTENTFTDSSTVCVRIDGSENINIDGNSFGSYSVNTDLEEAYSDWYDAYVHFDDPFPNLQLNGCTDIDITHNRLYNSQLSDCTDILVSRNDIFVIEEVVPQSFAAGVLIVNGTNAVVSNNTGGNLYISGTGHVISDNSYRSIFLEVAYDSVVSDNILSTSTHDLYVYGGSVDLAGDFPLRPKGGVNRDSWYNQSVISGAIILSDSDRNLINGNAMSIYLFGSSYNNISCNTMEGGKSYGGYCGSLPDVNTGSTGTLFYNYTRWTDGVQCKRGVYGVGLEISGDVEHESEYNVIWNNTIANTVSYGILINDIYCSFNLIHNNVLDSNNGATKSYDLSEQAQALDKGPSINGTPPPRPEIIGATGSTVTVLTASPTTPMPTISIQCPTLWITGCNTTWTRPAQRPSTLTGCSILKT
jgi:hypothetical protein